MRRETIGGLRRPALVAAAMAAIALLSLACAAPQAKSAAAEPITDDFLVPHAPPAMTLVKAGSFAMGDETGELWDGTRPVHEVTLSYDFLIGTYQVTFDEYDRFTLATGRHALYDFGWGRERRPVVNLTWWDMVDFCNWLSLREGLKPAYNADHELIDAAGRPTTDVKLVEGYRLPTEAEWEYAASGGHAREPGARRFLFPGSDLIDEVAWYSGNTGDEWVFKGSATMVDYSMHGAALYEGRSTQPVGLKKPNELGIYDLGGNVWEWCHDWYAEYDGSPKLDPVGAADGHVRVIRGGSWIFGANDCRTANRYWRGAYDKNFRIGFRIARTAPRG